MTEGDNIFNYDDQKKHTILVVDDSIVIRKMVTHILDEQNYNYIQADDGSKAVELLQKEKIDFVITDINMPQLGGFALIKKLNELKLGIPYIMITDADINKYLKLAIDHNVGNILSKPIEKTELQSTVHKLLYPETLFGLKNDQVDTSLKKIEVDRSDQCEQAVLEIVNTAEKAGLEKDFIPSLRLILSELAINALYHPHGFTDKKIERVSVQLKDGDKVVLEYGHNDLKFGVSITDYEGKLTKSTILTTFKNFIDNNEKMIKAIEEGKDPVEFVSEKGRGLQLAREMANEYYFNIKSNEITQIIILSWLEKKPVTHASQSIKINEL
ncbi:MAG: hypothetical protein IEMM0008_0220 [bacterium]|nr:MAG: hypothetical protein IEMM0008_0220 [bacterium]